MTVSKAQKKATTKFEHNNYKKICLRLPAIEGNSDLYNEIVRAAGNAGKSLNGYIIEAVREKMQREK